MRDCIFLCIPPSEQCIPPSKKSQKSLKKHDNYILHKAINPSRGIFTVHIFITQTVLDTHSLFFHILVFGFASDQLLEQIEFFLSLLLVLHLKPACVAVNADKGSGAYRTRHISHLYFRYFPNNRILCCWSYKLVKPLNF